MPAGRGKQGSGLCSGHLRLRQSPGQPELLHGHCPALAAHQPGTTVYGCGGHAYVLPRMLKVAELRAEGRSPEEIKRFVADALARGVFQPTTRAGITYMLSTESLVPDDKGVVAPFPPHVMFYAPYLTNADLGSEGQSGGGPAFVASAGTPYALIIVPVGGAPNGPPHKHPGDSQ